MRITIEPTEWCQGFEDGQHGRPGKVGGTFSYFSGYVEGNAKFQGFQYSVGTLTNPPGEMAEHSA